jgi:hypothetical protein
LLLVLNQVFLRAEVNGNEIRSLNDHIVKDARLRVLVELLHNVNRLLVVQGLSKVKLS